MSEGQKTFLEILADSHVFEEAVGRSKERFRDFVRDFGEGGDKVERKSIEMERALLRVEAAQERVNKAMQRHGADSLATKQAQLGLKESKSDLSAVKTEQSGGSGLGAMVGNPYILAMTAAAGAGVGLFAVLEHLVTTTANYSVEVLRNSQTIGLSTRDMQVWMAIAERMGIDNESLTKSIGRFNKELNDGAPNLKAAGTSLEALGIDTRDTGKALLEVADYFHTHTDAAQKDAIALALFGKQGLTMVPILNQGGDAVREYGKELEHYGIVLSDAQLATGAAASVLQKDFKEALTGLERQLAAHATPAFIALYQVMLSTTVGGKKLFEGLGDAIAQVIGFIAGAIAGLTGASIKISDVGASAGAAFDGLGKSIEGAGNSTNAAKGGLDALRESTRDATNAIDDQVAALQRQQQEFDRQIQDMQLQQTLQDELHQSTLAKEQDALDALKHTNDESRRSGESLVAYRRRLGEQELTEAIKKEQGSRALQKTQLEIRKQEMTEETNSRIQALQDQKKALERHLQDEEAAAKASGNAIGDELAAAGAKSGVKFSAEFAKGIQGALEKGQKFGLDFKEGLLSSGSPISAAAYAVGKLVGRGIVEGMGSTFTDWAKEHVGSPLVSVFAGFLGMFPDGHAEAPVTANNSDAHHGHAFGTISRSEHLAWVSEGDQPEAILPLNNPARSLALMKEAGLDRLVAADGGGGGGVVQNITFTGPVAHEFVADRVVGRLAAEARRRSLGTSGRG